MRQSSKTTTPSKNDCRLLGFSYVLGSFFKFTKQCAQNWDQQSVLDRLVCSGSLCWPPILSDDSKRARATSFKNTSPLPHLMTSTKRKNLTANERKVVVSSLLQRHDNGALQHGAIAASTTGVHEAPSFAHRAGRKRIDISAALDRLRSPPHPARSTVRSAAAVCGLAPSTLHRKTVQGEINVAALWRSRC